MSDFERTNPDSTGTTNVPRLYTKKEAADELRISSRQLDFLIARNLVPYRRKAGRGIAGQIAFTSDDLMAIIESWRVGPAAVRSARPQVSARRPHGV
jgi:hypothetical protein